MTKNKISFSLVSLNVCTYGADSSLSESYPGESLFDCRSDFAINFKQSALAVLLVFSNERALKLNAAPGIRRYVSVALCDVTDSCILSTTTVRVSIPRGEVMGVFRVDFPFAYSNIHCEHSYKVCVRDDNTGQILGERVFNLFDEYYGTKHISDCFIPFSGGVVEIGGSAIYKAFHARYPGYYAVRFRLQASFEVNPWRMPEMEVRICYPDGSIDSRFVSLECEDYDMGQYVIEVPFFMEINKRGICYAELICMDYPVAGFVFSTDSEPIVEAWMGRELESLDEYSLEAAVSRFRELTIPEEPETGAVLTDDDFENALQNFIESQMYDDLDSSAEDAQGEADEVSQTDAGVVADNPADEYVSDDAGNESTGDDDVAVADEVAEGGEPSIMISLSRLTGLTAVKEKLSTYEKVVKFNAMRRDNNLSTNSMPLHSMFLGSPGTGKTTVAKRMGVMLRRAGLLSKGHVVMKERANLLGPYYSNEETNTLSAIEEAQGGILFIDEAYQLYQPNDPRDPGRFVIEALMTALADESKRDWMLILAGYPDEMRRMFEMNPGLKSRIPNSNIYVFEDFTESELMEIAENYLLSNNYTLSDEAYRVLADRLAADYSARDKKFGNARHVINLIQTEILPAMAVRVVSRSDISPDMLSVIQPVDIPAAIRITQARRSYIGYRA